MTIHQEILQVVNRWDNHRDTPGHDAHATVAVAETLFHELREAARDYPHDMFCTCDDCQRQDDDDRDHWSDYQAGLVA